MDFNMKQWRDQESEEEEQETSSCSKLPRLDINPHPSSPAALSLFAPQPTTTHFHYSSDHSSATKLPPRMGSYFSLAQWQELELQTLVFRHLISGAAVPPELLHLVKKSLVPSTPYYFCNPLHYHPSLLQSGYWGKAAMDPEPGRCRRTDGKKWRCSRDVVVGQKYCERHMHRGRNRSRKPVEIPTSATHGGGEASITALSHGMPAADGGGGPRFSLTGPFTSLDLLHHNRRPMSEKKWTFEVGNENSGGGGGGGGGGGDGRLRHFFDDWPRSVDEAATNLSISRSDFSLKLGSGDEGGERERGEVNWGMAAAWESSSRMGGPLAEALRSTLSPTSVLHRLQMISASASASQSSS